MIGIFDSGLGGLTVAREVMRQLPGFSVLYLGDTARTPYGNKSPELVRRYAVECGDWLVNHGAKFLIVACNTMSAVALDVLRSRFGLPIFDVVIPTVQEAARYARGDKRIGVIGTRATIASGVYERLITQINPEAQIFCAACPLFVPLVEEGWGNHPETQRIARAYLDPIRAKNVSALILGCTHYPFLSSVIQEYMGRRVRVVDSASATVKHLKTYLDAHPELVDGLPKGNRHEWYLTDVAPHHDGLASQWLGRSVQFRRAELATAPAPHIK